MTTQLELTPPPVATDTAWLETLMLNAGGWLTAADIATRTGHLVDDRQIRRLASASLNIISGDKGYRHADKSSIEELHHAASRLDSQSDKMKLRANRIRQYAHQRIG